MTAKTKHGHGAHPAAHGADPGTAHERLNRRHAMPGRPEGAMHNEGSGEPAASPVPMAPPMGMGASAAPGAPMGGSSMGASSGGDDEEGEQT